MSSLDFSLCPEPSRAPGMYSKVLPEVNGGGLSSICLLCLASLPRIKMPSFTTQTLRVWSLGHPVGAPHHGRGHLMGQSSSQPESKHWALPHSVAPTMHVERTHSINCSPIKVSLFLPFLLFLPSSLSSFLFSLFMPFY